VALVEAIASDMDALTVRERFAATDRTFAIWGGCASRGGPSSRPRSSLPGRGRPHARGARSDDKPPVELENPWVFRPFEVLTNLYGLPRYDELDPTPLLAPFFLLSSRSASATSATGDAHRRCWYIKNKIDVAPA